MKLMIVGASGVLGAKLYNEAIKKKWNTLGTYCSRECEGLFSLDLRDKKSIYKIFHFFNPEVVILAGGITDVDICELKPSLAREVNIEGTLNVIKNIKDYGAKLVYLSTDYVFDGKDGPYKEDDNPAPINVYGASKLEAENSIRSKLKSYLIVRTSQLYGFDYRKRNFAVKIIMKMRNNKKIHAADDFYSTPTYVGDLSLAVIELIEKNKRGTYHIAGSDFIHRYEYVNKIADIFMLDNNLIERVKLKDLRLKAKRPKEAGLEIGKIKKEIKASLHSCEKGLRLFKNEM